MKIRLETIVEIPDSELNPDSPISLENQAKQIVIDGIPRCISSFHAEKGLRYSLSGKTEEARREDAWFEICSNLDWKLTVE